MASYTFRSWETITMPRMDQDTDFIVYSVAPAVPGELTQFALYTGHIIGGYALTHLDDILSRYTHIDPPDFLNTTAHVWQDDEQMWTYVIWYTTDDWQTDVWYDTVTIIYDWSYDNSDKIRKSTKPTNLLDYRQIAVASMMSRDGAAEQVAVTLDGTTVFQDTIDSNSTWTVVVPLWTLEYDSDGNETPADGTYAKLTIAGSPYYVTKTCYRYCLYYSNKWGGWDYMLFSGRELQTDQLSRLNYLQNYDSGSIVHGTKDYLTTIRETWSLNTGWLTEEQAEKLSHLFTSNNVWLYDLHTYGKFPAIIPVNISSTTFEHKTHRSTKKLFSYTVECQSSQSKFVK